MQHWHLGELEDVRPCDGCGRDYVFLVGEDPGMCAGCLRLERQLHEAIEADTAGVLQTAVGRFSIDFRDIPAFFSAVGVDLPSGPETVPSHRLHLDGKMDGGGILQSEGSPREVSPQTLAITTQPLAIDEVPEVETDVRVQKSPGLSCPREVGVPSLIIPQNS